MPGWRDLFTPIAELEEQEPQILEVCYSFYKII